ncbi:MAG: hypothetical protein DMD35_15655 [Gemmatimonadetes bacterium]|nr:MAG: hypothetical protein DMD35_15655 [Gemmatimonadota bacterium]
MSTASVLTGAAAVVLLLLAHVMRAVRHSFLFARDEVPGRFDLLLALSLSYAFNAIVPLRLGELLRAGFIAMRLRLRVSYVLATVAAERLSDLGAVSIIVAVIAARSEGLEGPARTTALLLLAAACALVALALLIEQVPAFRRMVWQAASLFNDSIRIGIVELLWIFSRYVTQKALTRPRFLLTTIVMWALYLGAYALFASAMGIPTSVISLGLLGAPLRPLLGELFSGGLTRTGIALLAFTSIPVVIVLAFGAVRHRREIRVSLDYVRRFGLMPRDDTPLSMSRRFRSSADYAALMLAHFTTSREIIASFADDSMGDAIVHRILPGGSDAVTAVVESGGLLGIRKLAMDAAATKLVEQVDWLRAYATRLPLPRVAADAWNGRRYHYDMPFSTASSDFYEVIHTVDVERSVQTLGSIVDVMCAFHSKTQEGEAEEATIVSYLDRKVRANARVVLDFVDGVLPTSYTINGEPYSLDEWDCLLDPHWLRAQVSQRGTAVIHGDLTIENIIVSPEEPTGWYLIDPNPVNIFSTPLIDWAKLMQSLNLGYETMNRGGVPTINGSSLRLVFARSNAYALLHGRLCEHLHSRLGVDGMREIAFHEIVHYLRLIPYKIRSAPQKGLTFFACASVLLRRYRETSG